MHLYASWGVHTIGSPRILNEVLIRRGIFENLPTVENTTNNLEPTNIKSPLLSPKFVSIPDLKQRFDSIVNYIRQNGKMPKAPILYLNDVKKYEIFDGNHRLSAYYYCYGYFNVDGDSNSMLKTQEDQTYWVASDQRTVGLSSTR